MRGLLYVVVGVASLSGMAQDPYDAYKRRLLDAAYLSSRSPTASQPDPQALQRLLQSDPDARAEYQRYYPNAQLPTLVAARNNLSDDQMEEQAHLWAAHKMLEKSPDSYTAGYSPTGANSRVTAAKNVVWKNIWKGREAELVEHARTFPRDFVSGADQGEVRWALAYDAIVETEFERLIAGGAPRVTSVGVNGGRSQPQRSAPRTPPVVASPQTPVVTPPTTPPAVSQPATPPAKKPAAPKAPKVDNSPKELSIPSQLSPRPPTGNDSIDQLK